MPAIPALETVSESTQKSAMNGRKEEGKSGPDVPGEGFREGAKIQGQDQR